MLLLLPCCLLTIYRCRPRHALRHVINMPIAAATPMPRAATLLPRRRDAGYDYAVTLLLSPACRCRLILPRFSVLR